MSERLTELAARKQLLLARSRLHRLQLQHQTRSLRRSIARPATVLAVATSAPVRPLLFSALLFVAGRGRAARVIRTAMVVLTVVKVASAATGWLSGSSATPESQSPTPK